MKKKNNSGPDFPLAEVVGKMLKLQGIDDGTRPYMSHANFEATIHDANSSTVVFHLSFHRLCWKRAIDIDDYSLKVIDVLHDTPGVRDISRFSDDEWICDRFSCDFKATTMEELSKMITEKVDEIMRQVDAI